MAKKLDKEDLLRATSLPLTSTKQQSFAKKDVEQDMFALKTSPLPDTKQEIINEALENKKIEDWFTQVTNDIQNNIIRDQIKTSPQIATQMLSRFGFKSPNDLTIFLKSPAGKSVRASIIKQISLMKARNEMLAFNQVDQQKQHALAMLVLGLAYDKASAAKENMRRLNDEAVHERLKAGEEALAEQQKRLDESQQSLDESAELYQLSTEALESILDEHEQEFGDFESHFDEIETLEAYHIEEGNFIDNLLLNIEDFFGLEPEKQERLTQNDPAVLKHFPKEKIIVKEDGVIYLINAGQNLKDLSQEDKQAAHQAYLQLKPEFNNLQNKIKQVHHDKRAEHEERKAQLRQKVVQRHEDITFLAQQLSELHEARQAVQVQRQAKLVEQKLDPAAQEQELAKAQQQAEKKPTLALIRMIKLMNRMNRLDAVADLSSSNRLGEPQFLAESHRIEQGGPIPGDLTLRSLLQQANTLGAVITKAPTAEASQKQRERLYPDAEPTIPKTQPKAEPDDEAYKSKAPSPFSTKNQPK